MRKTEGSLTDLSHKAPASVTAWQVEPQNTVCTPSRVEHGAAGTLVIPATLGVLEKGKKHEAPKGTIHSGQKHRLQC